MDPLQYIKEASLSRVWQMTSDPNKSFVMMTASKDDLTPAENQSRNRSLESDIRQAGLGFFKLYGHYVMDKGGPSERPTDEESYFISGEDKNALAEFARRSLVKYNQESALIKDDTGTYLLFRDGKRSNLGRFVPDRAGEYYSIIRGGSHSGRTFVFESVRKSLSGMDTWALKRRFGLHEIP